MRRHRLSPAHGPHGRKRKKRKGSTEFVQSSKGEVWSAKLGKSGLGCSFGTVGLDGPEGSERGDMPLVRVMAALIGLRCKLQGYLRGE
jgi:hypothetical protein